MTRNKKIGLVLVIIPIASLIFAIVGYAIASFVVFQSMATPVTTTQLGAEGALGLAPADPRVTTLRIIRVALGLLGLVGVLGLMIGTPIGIYFLSKKDPAAEAKELEELKQKEAYKNLSPEQMAYILKWSWGAFFSSFIWPLGNKLYLWTLGSLVPFFNIYVWIKLAISGRKMAWEKGGWQSFDQFKKRQKIMAWIILALFVLGLLMNILDMVQTLTAK